MKVHGDGSARCQFGPRATLIREDFTSQPRGCTLVHVAPRSHTWHGWKTVPPRDSGGVPAPAGQEACMRNRDEVVA